MARKITSIASKIKNEIKASQVNEPKSWLINIENHFCHGELDFAIRFTPHFYKINHSRQVLDMYWPFKFNYPFNEPLSGTVAEFSNWVKQEGYFTEAETNFGLAINSNAIFIPNLRQDIKSLVHRYLFCIYLFDDLYETLMSSEKARGMGDQFAHNFREITSGKDDLGFLDKFATVLKQETIRAKLIQKTTHKVINEAKDILSANVLKRWFEMNFITYTTCAIESNLWRDKVAESQFVTKQEYANVKRFNSDFHTVLFILLSEPDLQYYPTDEPLSTSCSIVMSLDNDLFSFPKERQQQVNPYNTISKFEANGHSEYEAFKKLITIRNEMVRSVEVVNSFLPEEQQTSMMKCNHLLGGSLYHHSTSHRFGWTNTKIE